MVSDQRDNIRYLSVDDMNRRRYWLTGEPREDAWSRISRPKLGLMSLTKAPEFFKDALHGIFFLTCMNDYFLPHTLSYDTKHDIKVCV